ncbi:MAG: cytochrome P450 [Myxococcales bacterium]|nr:cytochrome P450 [Myxococcales bacterium]
MVRHPPAPAGLPGLGHLLAMRKDPLGLCVAMMHRHGGLVRLDLGRRPVYLVTHPDLVQEVLQQQHRSVTKQTFGMAQLALVVGNGLLTSDGEFWRRQRRIAQPAFHGQRLAGFAATMVQVAEDTAQRWAGTAAAGAELDVSREMMAATLSIVSTTLLGTDLRTSATEVVDALDFLLLEVRRRMISPWLPPLAVPTPANRRFRRARATLDALLGELIAARRAGAARGQDLLQMLVDAVDDQTGEPMTAAQLRDEVVTIFIAGHETTASALAWTCYLLALHPAARDRVWAELDAVLGGRSPTLGDLPALPFLGQVLDESMRLFPPAWLIARQTAAPMVVGGFDLPADHTILLSPYAVHRAPAFWPNPLAFDPDRFAPARVAHHHRFQYIPFGAATRMCIGKGFALAESKLILATILQRYRLDLVCDRPVVPQPAVTLRPRDGIFMTVHARAAAG